MYICICNQVNDRRIAGAVREGARTLDDLAMELDVGTCCGKCGDDARRVIENTLARDRLHHQLDQGTDLIYDATA
jgi:bacterioferritin-associated ferredoxin